MIVDVVVINSVIWVIWAEGWERGERGNSQRVGQLLPETSAAADQRNLITKVFIADIAAEGENDRRENVRKLAQAHDVLARTVYAALMRAAKLSKKSAGCVNKWFS